MNTQADKKKAPVDMPSADTDEQHDANLPKSAATPHSVVGGGGTRLETRLFADDQWWRLKCVDNHRQRHWQDNEHSATPANEECSRQPFEGTVTI